MEFKDTYKYSSADIARYIIAKANELKYGINLTKVQKLLYIVYGVYLRVYKERLTDEHPQAWPYGPVFPNTREMIMSELNTDNLVFSIQDVKEEIKDDEQLTKVMDFVFSYFGTWNAGQLTEWTHRKNTPWSRVTDEDDFCWGDIIPDTYIYEFFLKLVSVNEQEG